MEKRHRAHRPSVVTVLAIGLLAANILSAQKPLNLQDCLNLAFQNNVTLRIAVLNQRLSEAKTAEAKAQIWPSLSVSGLYTHLGKVTSFTVPMGPGGSNKTIEFGTSDKVNVDAKLQMPIFTWGRISGTINLARVGLTISDVLKRQEMLNVTDQVLRAFYAVVLNREIISVHESSVLRAENYLQIAEKRFSTGNVSKLDLLRAQVQLKNTESALAETKDNLAKSKIYLSKVVGRKDTVMNIVGSMNHEPVAEKDEELISKAESIRSDLNILQAQLEMNEMGIRLARSGNRPSLYAFSGYSVQNGFNPMEPEKFVDNWNAGVQLSIPLFDGFSTKHKVEEARIELQKTKLQKEEILDLIRIQIQQVLISLHQAEEKIATQEDNIVLSREALRTAEIQYQNGIVSSLELTDAQQALTQSELFYTQAVFNHVMSKLELCKAVGDYHWFEFLLQENK